jgi:hypothetical protein
MATQVDDLYAEKHSIIDELFIKTADDANVREFGDDLLPACPAKPPRMPPALWRKETFEEFIGRLYQDGQADNRYQLYGYTKMPEDLWKLDQLVFNIRRMCCPLDVNVMGEDLPGGPRLSHRQNLKAAPKHWALYSRLEDALNGKLGEEVKRAAETWNFPFTPENCARPQMSYSSATKDSVFVRRLFDPLKVGPAEFAKSDKLWSWVRSYIKLPRDFIQEIEEERERLKTATAAPPAADT